MELEQIRMRGYSTSNGELATGAAAIAAPVFDYSQKAVGGISISGPEHFYSEDVMEQFCEQMLSTAHAISKELGYFAD